MPYKSNLKNLNEREKTSVKWSKNAKKILPLKPVSVSSYIVIPTDAKKTPIIAPIRQNKRNLKVSIKK